MIRSLRSSLPWIALAAALAITVVIYWPGLSGGFLFDDYPNIVDNHDLQIQHFSLGDLVGAALSSPASEFRRPLASLSFAINYLASGLDPYGMKLTNLVIHLLNGWLIFILARMLLRVAMSTTESNARHINLAAVLIAFGWMALPINVTAVLYVVQRMESLANLFVLAGMIGYVYGRQIMLRDVSRPCEHWWSNGWKGFLVCALSATAPVALGALAKETAVMLPLYALSIEWALFGFKRKPGGESSYDKRLIALFILILALPLLVGTIWLMPRVLSPQNWLTRNFTLSTRLFSEARVVVDYIGWTVLPFPDSLSFYHDDFVVSTGLLHPWTTLASMLLLAGLILLMVRIRSRLPLAALGIALFLGCQLLTATILPLELVYEHRNYFASFGLMLVVIPPLLPALPDKLSGTSALALPRVALLASLLLLWSAETAMTAMAWRSPLELAVTLAARAPNSPRAQYELGRTYIIYSHYDPASMFTKLAYEPLERAAKLQGSSILPEQALIFMNARMQLPTKQAWWDSLIGKLKAGKPGVQDESSLASLTQCARDHECDLPTSSMTEAFQAALSHPGPSARLLAIYSDYAWNVLGDHKLGEAMIYRAVQTQPEEPAYRVTLTRMYIADGNRAGATQAIEALQKLNLGGRLDADIGNLQESLK
jgi:protein O-mannosyl-transferase